MTDQSPRQTRNFRLFAVIAAGLVLAIIAGVVVTREGSEGSNRFQRGGDSAIGVEAAQVARREMREIRVFSGTLMAEKQYDAAAKVGGQIRQMAVQLGDCVPRGALIARLDNEEYLQQVAQAQAELEVSLASLTEAQSALNAAERDYRRASDLRAQGVASLSELEMAETAREAQAARVALAQAQINQRQASLRAAEIRLAYTEIRAEWENGSDEGCRHAAVRHVDQGDMIAANSPVVTLVDLSELKAIINVAERDYARLAVGQQAGIAVDFLPGRSFEGTVARLAPVFAETSRQARVEIAVPNPDNILKAGMFARVEIELGRAENALVVPATALIQRGTARGSFVIDDENQVRFVALETGIENEGMVAVEGLSEGERVVTLGHHLLSDGMRVVTADDAPVVDNAVPARSGAQGRRSQ